MPPAPPHLARGRHAVVVRENDSCAVTDQGSLNGTYLNGRLIDRPTPLTHGDERQIGAFILVYVYAGTSTADLDDRGVASSPPTERRP